MILGWLLSAWTFVGKIPYVKQIATFALVFLAGFAIGNYHATQRAVRQVAEIISDRDAREQAAATRALIEWKNKTEKAVMVAMEEQRISDNAAHASLEAGLGKAKRDADAARALLARERVTSADLRKQNDDMVHTLIPVAPVAPDAGPLICGGADTRRVLDQASGARDSAAVAGNRDSPSEAARSADAEASKGPELTCDQLLAGYVNLSEWGRGIASQLEALQTWERAQ